MHTGVAIGTAGVRQGDAAWVDIAARWVWFACGAFLLFAYVAQRTQWVAMGGRRGNKLFVIPDPNAWNLWVSLCGVVAIAALVVGFWSHRWEGGGALVAAADFAGGGIVAGGYWTGPPPGMTTPDGRSTIGLDWTFQAAGGPPTFAIAALMGIVASLVIGARARSRTRDTASAEPAWPRGDGSDDAWFHRSMHAAQEGRPMPALRGTRRATPEWGRDDVSDGVALAVAIGCAVVLLLALVAFPEFARTSWLSGGANRFSRTTDSPAGYVGLLSLGGLVALAALGIAATIRRLRVVGALVSAAAFGFGAFVAAIYALRLWRGVMGAEGWVESSPRSPGTIVDAPELLPFFVLAAILGMMGALAYAFAWWPQRPIEPGEPVARRPNGTG